MNNFRTNSDIQELESPFLNLTNFKQHQSIPTTNAQNAIPVLSPFKSVYELNGIEQGNDTENEAFVELMDELYDEEFDDILQEMANESQELYESQLSNNHYELQNYEIMNRQSLYENFTPFLKEVEQFMNHMASIANQNRVQNITGNQWDSLVDQYIIQMETSPSFEYWGWFKKIAKKVKKVARAAKRVVNKGVSIAKKFGLGVIIKKLKKIILKFLKGVLTKGLNRLPAKYRPIAKTLAKKIGILKETPEYEDEQHFQQELDSVITELLLAPNEIELEMIEQKFLNREDTYPDNSLAQLETAREVFIRKAGELQEGENPEPIVEEFVTAVLTGIKLAVRIIGKKKVKGIAVNLISRLIQRYVGRRNARMLAKQLVGTGFKMLNLELTPEQEVEDGGRAVASVVENTIRRISKLPKYILENEALLENNIIHAFEMSAKTNFPDILSEETYKRSPYLRESINHKISWGTRRNGKRKRSKYNNINKEIETELTPYLAQEIKTFGGVSLENMLRDQMGIVVNRKIPVKIHLYETLQGASRFHIGRNEEIIHGQGNVDVAYQLIHPLTTVAAGLLMGEPALGCKSKTKCLSHKHSNTSHRYYYLEIPGARPQMYSAPSGVQYLRKTTGLKIKLNFIRNQIQIFLFLSETDTQSIASQMRQNMASNAVRLGSIIFEAGLKTAFSEHAFDNIMIVHPNVIPGKGSGNAKQYIPSIILNRLKSKIRDWTEANIANHFMNQSDEFVRAADADADGVTICISMEAPSDFNVMGRFLNLKKAQIPENIFSEKSLEIIIKVKPGYHYA